MLQDSVSIQVDTDNLRLEGIYIKTPNGTLVQPMAVSHPQYSRAPAIGSGAGTGAGVTGVSAGPPIPIGPAEGHSLTTATFDKTAIGPAPWELHIKLQNVPEAVIPKFGGTPNAK